MNNYLQIAGHSFSMMFFEPRLNEANYINLPMKREEFLNRMSHYEDGGKQMEFMPVFENITFKDPETIGLKRRYKYEELSELNYLAYLISELEDSELVVYKAILTYAPELDKEENGITRLINLTQNTYNFDYEPNFFDLYDLGKRYMIKAFGQTGFPEEMENMLDLFDFCEIGERFLMQMKGHLFTPGGFFEVLHDDAWKKVYTGELSEIPKEYCLMD